MNGIILSLLGGSIGCVLGGFWFFGVALLCLLLLCIARAVSFELKRKRDCLSFDRDYPVLLTSLAASLKAGMDPVTALIKMQELFPDRTAMNVELTGFKDRIDAGIRDEDAILRFGAATGHPDISLLQAALLLSLRHGASLGECLHRLTRVSRQRQSFRRKVRAATAMQRLSAAGISVSAVFMLVMQIVTNSSTLMNIRSHPTGLGVIISGISLMVLGAFLMSRVGIEEAR